MEQLRIEPIGRINGTVNVPGSKSLSNRALLLAALAQGTTHLTNLLDSDDIRHMLNALRQLGVSFELSSDKTQCTVTGLGGRFSSAQCQQIFLGNAGTAMRPLCAVLAASEGEFILTGEPRMQERPIGALVDALAQVGAQVEYVNEIGYPPLKIHGNQLQGGKIEIDGSVSSQFLTAVLMAAPLFNSDSEIVITSELVSKPYIDITLNTMAQFGVSVDNQNYQRFLIKGNQQYQAVERFLVEGDASSASYFLAAAAIKGGTVKVTGVGAKSIQGDIRFADVLEKMGAKIRWGDDFIEATGGPLSAIDMDMNHIPDAAMTIATTALFATGKTRISNIFNWRVKETDRLAAMATELRKVGAEVTEGHDFIEVNGLAADEFKAAEIDTYDDHRIAMCFSLVALSSTAVIINDPGCTAKTFPDYFQRLAQVSHAV